MQLTIEVCVNSVDSASAFVQLTAPPSSTSKSSLRFQWKCCYSRR
jgi:hypothetical protein